MKKLVKCTSCIKTPGVLIGYEGQRLPCCYCKGTKKRAITVPHSSHRMQRKWHTEILAPAGTERFYSVRSCIACGEREEKAAAGHFFNGLLQPCK